MLAQQDEKPRGEALRWECVWHEPLVISPSVLDPPILVSYFPCRCRLVLRLRACIGMDPVKLSKLSGLGFI